ncbi:LysR family transcriptional regulator [Anaerobacillus sp. CMMVII]|uniref:LysR family transcriptional regulator n=1 Tax=Anaerobacillus sp. CMMVII TaxID=2755588 RepID=UPI0021B716A8|nr:LysR family transcriptional regulator [Anaerobacillus sp. CMMVII]MCT8139131.1 LysR family transcriptional regulator [Anaerobacillus sp. CMMVII]
MKQDFSTTSPTLLSSSKEVNGCTQNSTIVWSSLKGTTLLSLPSSNSPFSKYSRAAYFSHQYFKAVFGAGFAVSRQIEALEKHFKLPLFYRTKKKVELTDAGRQLLNYAIQIISLANQAEKALSSLTNLESGELSVGCGTTIGTFVISNLVIDFQKKIQI